MCSHWINLHLYNLSNVAYICLYYLPLPLKYQAKVLLSICGVKYLMGLIIEHGLNHIVGNNWIFAGVPAHRQIVINWMNKDFCAFNSSILEYEQQKYPALSNENI